MGNTVISVENLSKRYKLGVVGYGTLKDDMASLWARIRGKEDPNAQIGKESRLGKHGEFWALRDISFEVQQGDRVGIIGRNGAGKSTLLKLLSRITAPTEGKIKVKGRIASLLEVGTGFHPELTGRENVFLNGAILGMRRREIQRKFDEIVEFSGVENFIDTPVKRYSSGMYVRLAFSVAAHLDSDILIVDEVLAVGDAEFQKKCINKMEELNSVDNRTILFVSHIIPTIMNLCTKGILMSSGKIDCVGEIKTIVDRYHEFYSPENINIKNIKDRSGNQRVILENVEFVKNSRSSVNINQGEPLELVFSLMANDTKKKKIDCGFSIHDSQDRIIFVDYTSYHNKSVISNSEKIDLNFKWERCLLTPGKYTIRARILVDNEESDWIKPVVKTFKVVEADFYLTGNTGYNSEAIIAVDGNWTC